MYPDHNMVCYSGDLILYLLLSHYDSLVNHKPHSSGIWHFYLVYRKGHPTGLLYDLDNGTFRSHVAVDTALRTSWFSKFDAYNLLQNKHALVSGSGNEKGNFTETYKLYPDSIGVHMIFHFTNRYRDVPFTLSRELDSIKQAKLYSVELFLPLPGAVDSATASRIPAITYELAEVDSVDKVRPYFERFARDAAK